MQQQHSCFATLISNDGNQQLVQITTTSGSLTIKLVLTNQQVVYIPQGSMDTILNWFRIIDQCQHVGTLDLDNPESHIKATFFVPLADLIQLEQILRGQLVYLRKPSYQVLSQIAPQVLLLHINGTNQRLVEKLAYFPLGSKDGNNISRLEQLRQETIIMMHLKQRPHKHILKLEEISTNYTSVSLLIEHCEGGDLLEILNQKKELMQPYILIQCLLRGIEHLHLCGIIHRDIKLQNVLLKNVDQDDSLKIADFGLASFKDQVQYYNPRCGTPGYTAPEIFDHTNIYDEKVDIYSAGIVLYNLITLKSPFGNHKGPQAIIHANVTGKYDTLPLEPIKAENPLLYELVIAMLELDPKKRPSATECLHFKYFNPVDQKKIQEEDEQDFDSINYEQMRDKSTSNIEHKQQVRVHHNKTCQMPRTTEQQQFQ